MSNKGEYPKILILKDGKLTEVAGNNPVIKVNVINKYHTNKTSVR